MQKNKVIEIIIISIILVVLLLMIFLIPKKSSLDIPAVITSDNTVLDINKNDKNPILSKGTKVTIKEFKDDKTLIDYNEQTGYVKKDQIIYFEFDENVQYSLTLDVSKFNLSSDSSENNSNKNFSDTTDFAKFIIDNNINYTYIRLCGRGWGSEGNLYKDNVAMDFAEICNYLKIPYGFYYIDEAKNDNEVKEEISFVKSLLDNKDLEMNKLPLVIDLEYQHGKGRTDDIWDERAPLINRLINGFKDSGFNTLVYANGARIEKYLKSLNCNFWVAMYPENDVIPNVDYKSFIVEEESKIGTLKESIDDSVLNSDINKSETEIITYSDEFLDKVVGWQFSESGAKKDGIDEYIDLSIFDNEYLKQFLE